MARILFALLILGPLIGCYRYTPVRPEAALEGAEVRLRVSDQGRAQADSVLGASSGTVDGRLTAWGEQVTLMVEATVPSGAARRTLERPVVVDASEVLGIELRQRDRVRTGLLIGGISAVVLGGVVAAISGTFGGSQEGTPNEQPEGTMIPLRIRIGW